MARSIAPIAHERSTNQQQHNDDQHHLQGTPNQPDQRAEQPDQQDHRNDDQYDTHRCLRTIMVFDAGSVAREAGRSIGWEES